jgi:hypothetical protein
MAKSKRVKHMKIDATVEVQLHFKGKRPELRILFPAKVAKQLSKRLDNRYGKKK